MEIVWASCNALSDLYSPDKIYVYSFNEAKDYHLHVHIKPKVRNVPIKGPCFVNWTDPKMEKMTKVKMQKRHRDAVDRIKENACIKELQARS